MERALEALFIEPTEASVATLRVILKKWIVCFSHVGYSFICWSCHKLIHSFGAFGDLVVQTVIQLAAYFKAYTFLLFRISDQ